MNVACHPLRFSLFLDPLCNSVRGVDRRRTDRRDAVCALFWAPLQGEAASAG